MTVAVAAPIYGTAAKTPGLVQSFVGYDPLRLAATKNIIGSSTAASVVRKHVSAFMEKVVVSVRGVGFRTCTSIFMVKYVVDQPCVPLVHDDACYIMACPTQHGVYGDLGWIWTEDPLGTVQLGPFQFDIRPSTRCGGRNADCVPRGSSIAGTCVGVRGCDVIHCAPKRLHIFVPSTDCITVTFFDHDVSEAKNSALVLDVLKSCLMQRNSDDDSSLIVDMLEDGVVAMGSLRPEGHSLENADEDEDEDDAFMNEALSRDAVAAGPHGQPVINALAVAVPRDLGGDGNCVERRDLSPCGTVVVAGPHVQLAANSPAINSLTLTVIGSQDPDDADLDESLIDQCF